MIGLLVSMRVVLLVALAVSWKKNVLHFLLKSKCPVILVLARKMYKVIPDELIAALHQGRLLIISTSKAIRQSKQTVGVTSKSSLCQLKDDYRSKLYGE